MNQLLDQRREVAMRALNLEMDGKDPRVDQSPEAKEARLEEIQRCHARLRAIKRELARFGMSIE